MLDSLLIAGVSLLAGALIVSSPWPVLIVLTAILAAAWTRIRWRQVAVATLLITLGSWRASNALAKYDDERGRARDLIGPPARCSGSVIVRSPLTRVRDVYSLIAQAQKLECEGSSKVAPGTMMRIYSPIDDLARGDTCEVITSLATVEIPRNFEVDMARTASARNGAVLSGGALDVRLLQRSPWSIGGWIDRARRFARRRIEATYPEQAAPMARALVLGENDLDPDDAEAFRVSGLSHILAVSGTHIVIAVFGIVRVLQALLVRVERLCARYDVGRIAAAAGVPLAWLYADFAGSGGSARRAAAMASAALLARALARNPDGPRSFGLSLLAGGLMDPLAVFDFSFGLSAAATAGLMLLSRPFEAAIRKLPRPFCWGAEPMATTLSATLLCTPWIVLLSPSISPVGVVANIVAVPIGEAISLPACLGHLLLSVWPSAERGVAWLASSSLLAVRTIAHTGAAVGWAVITIPRPTAWELSIVAGVGGWLALRRPRDRLLILALGAVAYVIVEAFAVRAGQPRGKLRVTFLDVGQGDSVLIDFPDGRAMLIDGGGAVGSPVDPGKTVVGPVLRARRRGRIDFAVLSHPHPDHFIGLASALPGVQVGEFWDNGQGELGDSAPVYRGLLSGLRARSVPVVRPEVLCNRPQELGGAQVRVLAPCPGIEEMAHANDNSFVMRVELGSRAALLVGDAEHEEEARLLSVDRSLLHADLLKVGHHGSRTSSSPEFIDAVRPSHAVISCGVRNRFGHPHPHTLETLAARGIEVHRTDREGSVQWETDGKDAVLRGAIGGN
ncbi:MAG: DNA internalization-related competence protein ComEC/Rec2 [Deltaproteobacteria bacterium]|nr:DNA internalization-related competence protein ComEC/Rec2 [Deltaproteobacteria bacterium]